MEQQSNDHLLLTTKLVIPLVRLDLVPRLHLFQKLEGCLEHSLTLLAAPAGFGKTVLLSAWARQRQRSVAWVSLDSSDNDPAQFWTYVFAALDTLHPGLGAKPYTNQVLSHWQSNTGYTPSRSRCEAIVIVTVRAVSTH